MENIHMGLDNTDLKQSNHCWTISYFAFNWYAKWKVFLVDQYQNTEDCTDIKSFITTDNDKEETIEKSEEARGLNNLNKIY